MRDVNEEMAIPNFNGMTKEKLDLLVSLEALLGCMKSLHATLGAVLADVAALRNTVLEDLEDIAALRLST